MAPVISILILHLVLGFQVFPLLTLPSSQFVAMTSAAAALQSVSTSSLCLSLTDFKVIHGAAHQHFCVEIERKIEGDREKD